jgi:hypothetical protein
MISPEAFNKFLADIQRQIEEADKMNKQRADDTLKAIAESYRQKVSERVAIELSLAEQCLKTGDDAGIRHHAALADIYKSLFKIQQTT